MACLVAVYGAELGRGTWAEIDPLLMIRPPRGSWAFITRNAAWVQKNGPLRLVATTVVHCFGVRSSSGTGGAPVPALLNNTSSRPKRASVASNSACTATKHAITGLTRSTSLDGRRYDIACGQIDIGNAYTPMTERMVQGIPQPDGRIMVEPVMDVQVVADAVLHMASLPLDANIQFMTVMATTMPFIGRG